jgi:hypothetical protein
LAVFEPDACAIAAAGTQAVLLLLPLARDEGRWSRALTQLRLLAPSLAVGAPVTVLVTASTSTSSVSGTGMRVGFSSVVLEGGDAADEEARGAVLSFLQWASAGADGETTALLQSLDAAVHAVFLLSLSLPPAGLGPGLGLAEHLAEQAQRDVSSQGLLLRLFLQQRQQQGQQ